MVCTVLVVDDVDAVRSVLRRGLEKDGHHVLEAADGREALRILARESVQVVVTDILMPELDGIEVITQMRSDYPEIGVIAISAPSNEMYLKMAKTLGAHRTLEKPFALSEIKQAVNELAARPGATSA
ncbi:MAG: response regulator [Planctomycetota bacterium]